MYLVGSNVLGIESGFKFDNENVNFSNVTGYAVGQEVWVRINANTMLSVVTSAPIVSTMGMDGGVMVQAFYRQEMGYTSNGFIDVDNSDMLVGNKNVSQLWEVTNVTTGSITFRVDSRSFTFTGGTGWKQ